MRKSSRFREVFQTGRYVAEPRLALHFLRTGAPDTRVGIAVSRKLGNAVVRNRMKRLLREASRKLPDDLSSGFDLVILARKPALKAPLTLLRASLTRLYQRIE